MSFAVAPDYAHFPYGLACWLGFTPNVVRQNVRSRERLRPRHGGIESIRYRKRKGALKTENVLLVADMTLGFDYIPLLFRGNGGKGILVIISSLQSIH